VLAILLRDELRKEFLASTPCSYDTRIRASANPHRKCKFH
jgi:hypothetical protein